MNKNDKKNRSYDYVPNNRQLQEPELSDFHECFLSDQSA